MATCEARTYLDGRYVVTRDGSVMLARKTQAGPAGRHLVPTMGGKGTVSYFVRAAKGENAKVRSVRRIVRDVYGVDRKFTEKDFHRLHDLATKKNASLNKSTDTKQAQRNGNGEKAKSHVPTNYAIATCPFRDMRTMIPEYPSWDCPEMDPLSCGQWGLLSNHRLSKGVAK